MGAMCNSGKNDPKRVNNIQAKNQSLDPNNKTNQNANSPMLGAGTTNSNQSQPQPSITTLKPTTVQASGTSKSLKIVNPNLEKHVDEDNYIPKYSKELNVSQNPNCIFLKEKVHELITKQPTYQISIDNVRLYEEESKIINYKAISTFVSKIMNNNTKYVDFIVSSVHQAFFEMKNMFNKSDIAALLTNFYLLIPTKSDNVLYKKEKLTIIVYFIEKYSVEKFEEEQVNVIKLKKTIVFISYLVVDFMINVIFRAAILENPNKYKTSKLSKSSNGDSVRNHQEITECILDVLIEAQVLVGFNSKEEAFNTIVEALVKYLCQPLKDTLEDVNHECYLLPSFVHSCLKEIEHLVIYLTFPSNFIDFISKLSTDFTGFDYERNSENIGLIPSQIKTPGEFSANLELMVKSQLFYNLTPKTIAELIKNSENVKHKSDLRRFLSVLNRDNAGLTELLLRSVLEASRHFASVSENHTLNYRMITALMLYSICNNQIKEIEFSRKEHIEGYFQMIRQVTENRSDYSEAIKACTVTIITFNILVLHYLVLNKFDGKRNEILYFDKEEVETDSDEGIDSKFTKLLDSLYRVGVISENVAANPKLIGDHIEKYITTFTNVGQSQKAYQVISSNVITFMDPLYFLNFLTKLKEY